MGRQKQSATEKAAAMLLLEVEVEIERLEIELERLREEVWAAEFVADFVDMVEG